MVHLFYKVYLKHESQYDSNHDSYMLFCEKKDHPLKKILDIGDVQVPAFEEEFAEKFSSDYEKFWLFLIQKTKERFDFYVDSELLHKFLIQFWKSIFKNANANEIYKLHSFYILDSRLKSFLQNDFAFGFRSELQRNVSFLSYEQFEVIYNEMPTVNVLKHADKSAFSFEYLMANYFSNPESQYAKAFKEKVYRLAWKSWVNDTEILKAEILNAFYDIKKLIPSIDIDLSKPQQVEQYLLTNPYLSWMLDKDFNENNPDYIRRNYNKNIFIELHKNMHTSWGASSETVNKISEEKFFIDDQIMQTDLLFDEKYDEYLQKNIDKGFGCIFINDHLRHKSNQIFASYIYEQVRNKQLENLKGYELE